MNPEFPQTPREEIEIRLTALLLGELPDAEAAALREILRHDAALAKLHDSLKQTIELVRAAAAKQAEPASAQAPLKLSEERRQQLLAHFKARPTGQKASATAGPKSDLRTFFGTRGGVFWKRPARRWLVPVAAAVVVLLLAAISIPKFVTARSTGTLGGGRAFWARRSEQARAASDETIRRASRLLQSGEANAPATPAPPSVAGGPSNVHSLNVVGYVNLPLDSKTAKAVALEDGSFRREYAETKTHPSPATSAAGAVVVATPPPSASVPAIESAPPRTQIVLPSATEGEVGAFSFDAESRQITVLNGEPTEKFAARSTTPIAPPSDGKISQQKVGDTVERQRKEVAVLKAESDSSVAAVPEVLPATAPALNKSQSSRSSMTVNNGSIVGDARYGLARLDTPRFAAQLRQSGETSDVWNATVEDGKVPVLGDLPAAGRAFRREAPTSDTAINEGVVAAKTPAAGQRFDRIVPGTAGGGMGGGGGGGGTLGAQLPAGTPTVTPAESPPASALADSAATQGNGVELVPFQPQLPTPSLKGLPQDLPSGPNIEPLGTKHAGTIVLGMPDAAKPTAPGAAAPEASKRAYGIADPGQQVERLRELQESRRPSAITPLPKAETLARTRDGSEVSAGGRIVPEANAVSVDTDAFASAQDAAGKALAMAAPAKSPIVLPTLAETSAPKPAPREEGAPHAESLERTDVPTGPQPREKEIEIVQGWKASDGTKLKDESERQSKPLRAYADAKRKLDEAVRYRQILNTKLTSEKSDADIPKTTTVEIVDKAVPSQKKTGGLVFSTASASTARVKVERDISDIRGLADSAYQSTYDPYFLQTEFEIIRSELILSNVVDRLKLNETWAGKAGGAKLKQADAIALLKSKLDLRRVGNTGLVEIGAKSDNPEEAAMIANAVAEAYQDYRREQRRQLTLTGVKVLEERLAEQEQKVKAAQQQVDALGKQLAKSEGAASTAKPATPAIDEDRPVRRPAANAPIPQPEVQTSGNAFSTFSLNVSDVAFKLAAASLEKGQMPDPASVRSEEFINAFDYRDPEPPPGVPVAFAWERARYPFAHNRDLLRFSIKTAAAGRQAGRPLNLVLLLDNSGSMERADRVQIIREALRVLAAQLQPQDTVSVITFARTARLWVDGISGSKAGEVFEQVGGLTPQGGTNLEEAMRLAYATALRHYLATGINRVVLLTDGAANLGNVDPDALKQAVETHRKQGIALDCFGIGWEGFNDDLLEVLSRNGDGRYGFINSPEEAADEFAGQLAGALKVAASDVKVQVEFNPARVTAYRQIGYAKHQLTKEQFRDNTVDAAEIAAQEAGNALYTVEVNPAGAGPLCTVRCRFKIPGTTDYREHAWEVPFTGSAVSLEQASSAMRLAATASAFSEWLVASPFAAEVTPDRLLGYLSRVPEVYGADARPKKLEWMIRQAKAISGP